jgi:hypothetical protein
MFYDVIPAAPKVMLFHASMKRMIFCPWYHFIQKMIFKYFQEERKDDEK